VTFGSLFSGIGGMDLGLALAGLECRWQVEKDPFCREILAQRWPHIWKYEDVETFPPRYIRRLRKHLGVDLICGGDPCQENSRARTADGLTQPSLGAEFLRIVEALRPRLVLRENPAQTRPDAPWPWHRFRAGLESLGYVVVPFRLRACCFGLDHQRDRLLLLASLPDADGQPVRLQGPDEDAGEAGEDEGEAWERERIRTDVRSALCPPRDRPHSRICRGADGLPRKLDAARLKALGNAFPPVMAEWIGRRLMAVTGDGAAGIAAGGAAKGGGE
jgi:DNA (cytosine-5)-methyltransferase 1